MACVPYGPLFAISNVLQEHLCCVGPAVDKNSIVQHERTTSARALSLAHVHTACMLSNAVRNGDVSVVLCLSVLDSSLGVVLKALN